MAYQSIHPLKLIMQNAWGYARKAQTVHGGKVKEWLSVSLKRAWAEVKADLVAQECSKIILEIRAQRLAGWTPQRPSRYDIARFAGPAGR